MAQNRSSIHKVPRKLVVDGDDRYEPHAVSIGPYHHGKDLEITEDHKRLYMKSFISRSKAPDTMKRDVYDKIREVMDAAHECYSKSIGRMMSGWEFVSMLELDGCFILELLCRNHEHKYQLVDDSGEDYIFNSTRLVLPALRRDLVLLENQIPFFVLERLFDLINSPPIQNRHPSSLNELITSFFNPILPTISEDMIDPSIRGEHLLDILRKHLLQNQFQVVINNVGDYSFRDRISCASDLQEEGVIFTAAPFTHALVEITFDDGKFKIPPFYFEESWIVLFANIIALEHYSEFKNEFTSYSILMGYLIRSQDDVKLLRRKEIISGAVDEDAKVANVVKDLCKNVVVDNFYYDTLCYRVNAYRKNPYHSLRASFLRDVIRTPWGWFSVAAAIILLVLTTVQTVFAVLSWSKQK